MSGGDLALIQSTEITPPVNIKELLIHLPFVMKREVGGGVFTRKK